MNHPSELDLRRGFEADGLSESEIEQELDRHEAGLDDDDCSFDDCNDDGTWNDPTPPLARTMIDEEREHQTLTATVPPEHRRDSTGDMFGLEKAQAVIEQRNRTGTQPAGPDLFS
jgi:hypothetical protein